MATKSTLTTVCSFLIILSSFFFDRYNEFILNTGLFALIGSLTNWLAIYMLFEKIPFFYGSGKITTNFERFKVELNSLVINEFFSERQIEKFLADQNSIVQNAIITKGHLDNIFDEFLHLIDTSKVGPMLKVVGGSEVLENLRNPIIKRLKFLLKNIDLIPENASVRSELINSIKQNIEALIERRLDELSSKDVNLIVKKLIKEHYGWLVLWGGILGGIIGFLVELLKTL